MVVLYKLVEKNITNHFVIQNDNFISITLTINETCIPDINKMIINLEKCGVSLITKFEKG